MKRGSYTRIALAGLLGLMLFTCSSCVYVHTGDMAMSRHEREVPLTAPLTAGSSFSAETGDGKGRIGLRTHDGSITVR
jgi:hypothetical protein